MRQLKFMVIIFGVTLLNHPMDGKVFEPCELGNIILHLDLIDTNSSTVGDWLCLANATSGYNSSLIGQFKPSATLYQYGIFQLSNYLYCNDEYFSNHDDCGLKLDCSKLTDDNLTDDLICANQLYRRGNNTFYHWKHVETVMTECNNNEEENKRFYEDCDFTFGYQPIISNEKTNFTLEANYIYPGYALLECIISATYPVKVTWLQDDKPLFQHDPVFKIINANGSITNQFTSSIILLNMNFYQTSFYFTQLTCEASNKYGKSSKDFMIRIIGSLDNHTETQSQNLISSQRILIAGISIPIVALIITLVCLTVYKHWLHKQNELSVDEVREFKNGSECREYVESTYIHDKLLTEPYNKAWEIQKDHLNVDKQAILGSGQFGIVYKGFYKGQPIAVKTVKSGRDKIYLRALMSELKVMIYVNGHVNVISLTGAYTNDLRKGILLVLLEFCPLGSLMKYLQTYRQSKHRTFIIEESLFTVTNLYVSNRTDDAVEIIDLEKMLRWCYQIASAMEYLGSKGVIHGDLATRNILLLNSNTIKVSDFGLSRKLYEYVTYVRGNDDDKEPLPWRWLAPEVLRDLTFSNSSDVWSYGVTLWEIFSLAQIPYPGLSWSLDFLKELEAGLRLLKPEYASPSIFNVMSTCWKSNSAERPTFTQLRQNIYTEMTNFLSMEYIELDSDDTETYPYKKLCYLPYSKSVQQQHTLANDVVAACLSKSEMQNI